MKVKKGDVIKFRLRYCGYAVPRTNVRKCTGIDAKGNILVHFAGYPDFILDPCEVVAVNGEEVRP